MPFLSLFTAPSSTSLMASVGEWSSTTFDNYLPVAFISIGTIVGALLIVFMISVMIRAIYTLFFESHEHFSNRMYNKYGENWEDRLGG